MKAIFLIATILSFHLIANGQIQLKYIAPPTPQKYLILKQGVSYTFNQQIVTSTNGNKETLLINLVSNHNPVNSPYPDSRLLVVIKVFLDSSLEKSMSNVRLEDVTNTLYPTNIIEQGVKVVLSHLNLDLVTMRQAWGEDPIIYNIGVILNKNGKYFKINGITLCQFFYLLDIPQRSILQSNLTLLSKNAFIGKHYFFKFNNGKDSIGMVPNIEYYGRDIDFEGKIYLEKKNSDSSYRFYRVHFITIDAPFKEVEEFDYLPDFGIISFASKFPRFSAMGTIDDSNEYYRFVKKN